MNIQTTLEEFRKKFCHKQILLKENDELDFDAFVFERGENLEKFLEQALTNQKQEILDKVVQFFIQKM